MIMKKDQPFALILAGALMLSLASSLAAQEQTGPRNWHHRSQAASEQQAGSGENHKRDFPRGPGFNLLSSEMRFGDKTVTGAPFSAQVEMESTRTLADGTRATHKGAGMLYRDSEGRIRHEMTVGVLGPFASAGDPPRMVFINDPVANAHYALDATNRTARKMSLPAGRPPHDMTAQGAGHQPPFDVKTESLGKQMIEGIEAEGTRSVITIPAGLHRQRAGGRSGFRALVLPGVADRGDEQAQRPAYGRARLSPDQHQARRAGALAVRGACGLSSSGRRFRSRSRWPPRPAPAERELKP
jgi:hypothetical protein